MLTVIIIAAFIVSFIIGCIICLVLKRNVLNVKNEYEEEDDSDQETQRQYRQKIEDAKIVAEMMNEIEMQEKTPGMQTPKPLQNPMYADSTAKKFDQDELDSNLCKICMDNPINTTLVPCGHVAIC